MELREYQSDILNEIRKTYKQGYKAPCLVLPCGGGKSVLAAEMAKSATPLKVTGFCSWYIERNCVSK